MPLSELQREFEGAVVGAAAVPLSIASSDAAERLEIYRGTVRSTLVKALALNFPAVQRLVGEEFFEWAASLFALDHLPTAADLNAYGREFLAFVHALPACAALAYLPEVARLDWAVSQALHAEDAVPLDADALRAVVARADAAAFVAHPSISLLACSFPVDEIWSGVLGGEAAQLESIDLACGPRWLIVERAGLRARVQRMDRPEWAFACDLLSGANLAEVVSRATPSAPAAEWIAGHMAAGRIVGVRLEDDEESP